MQCTECRTDGAASVARERSSQRVRLQHDPRSVISKNITITSHRRVYSSPQVERCTRWGFKRDMYTSTLTRPTKTQPWKAYQFTHKAIEIAHHRPRPGKAKTRTAAVCSYQTYRTTSPARTKVRSVSKLVKSSIRLNIMGKGLSGMQDALRTTSRSQTDLFTVVRTSGSCRLFQELVDDMKNTPR